MWFIRASREKIAYRKNEAKPMVILNFLFKALELENGAESAHDLNTPYLFTRGEISSPFYMIRKFGQHSRFYIVTESNARKDRKLGD
jgi:hypothetical protein